LFGKLKLLVDTFFPLICLDSEVYFIPRIAISPPEDNKLGNEFVSYGEGELEVTGIER
jgi:hypothetical protein